MTERIKASGERWRRGEMRRYADNQRDSSRSSRGAEGLGWLSIALGLAQIAAPRAVARAIGVPETSHNRATVRAIGVTFTVVGATVLAATSARERRALIAGPSAKREPRRLVRSATSRGGIHVVRAITVDRSPDEVYRLWREFSEVPAIMRGVEGFQVQNGHSRWRAHLARGTDIAWSAELVHDVKILEDESREGATKNAGIIRFVPAPGGQGTEIRCELRLGPSFVGGAVGKALAQPPSYQIEGALRRFKQIIETGEIVHSDASIHAGPHPARPSEKAIVPAMNKRGER